MLDPPVSGRTVTRRAEAGELAYLRKLPGPNGDYLFHPDVVGQYIADQAKAAALRAVPPVHTCHVNGDACDPCRDALRASALAAAERAATPPGSP